MNKNILIAFIAIVMLSGCFNGNSSGPGGIQQPPSSDDSDEGEISPEISKQYQLSLEQWKQRLVKRCDVEDVFGVSGRHQGPPVHHLDLEQLKRLVDPQGRLPVGDSWLILVRGDKAAGQSQSSYRVSETQNGQSQTLALQTRYSNGVCEVAINDTVVVSTPVIARLAIRGHVDQPRTTTLATEQDLSFESLRSGYARLNGRALSTAIQQLLNPNYDLIAESWSTTPEVARSLVSYQIPSEEGTLTAHWKDSSNNPVSSFSVRNPGLLLSRESIALLQIEGSLLATIRWNISGQGTEFSTAGFSFSHEFQTEIRISLPQENSLSSLEILRASKAVVRPFDRLEPHACLTQRAQLHHLAIVSSEHTPRISVDTLLEPCRTLGASEAHLENWSLLQIVLPLVIDATIPSPLTDFQDWDRFLVSAMIELLENEGDLQRSASSSATFPLLEPMRNEVQRMFNLLSSSSATAPIKAPYYRMAGQWASTGLSPDHRRLVRIVNGTIALAPALAETVGSLLARLGRTPQLDEGALDFTEQLGNDYVTAALAARAVKAAAGDSRWLSTVWPNLLQLRISEASLKQIVESWNRLQSFLQRYPEFTTSRAALESLINKADIDPRLSEDRLEDFMNVLHPLAPELSEATRYALAFVEANPDSITSLTRYLAALTPETRQLLRELETLALKSNVSEAKSAYGKEALVREPTKTQLEQDRDTLLHLTRFQAEEQSRASTSHLGQSSELRNIASLSERAWSQRWNEREYLIANEAAALIRTTQLRCESRRSVAATIECHRRIALDNSPKTLFWSGYGDRYHKLAAELSQARSQTKSDPSAERTVKRLIEDYLTTQPLWNLCDDPQFQEKMDSLKSLWPQLLSDSTRTATQARRALDSLRKNCAD